MIDTLTLDLQKYHVKDNPNLELIPARVNLRTGSMGQEADLFGGYVGAKAYVNTEKVHLDIFPCRDGLVHAFMHFSAPKQVEDDNYKELTYSGFMDALGRAEGELEKLGVEAKLHEAKITRLDLFKNIFPDEPVMSYAKVFELLEANYAKDKRTYGSDGWLMGNKQQQYCIYNKIQEMRGSGKVIEGLPETMRFEHRTLNSNKVETYYQFSTVEGLKRFGWDALYQKRRETWKRNFFKYEIQEVETLAVSQLVTELMHFKEKEIRGEKQRNWVDDCLRSYGAYYLCEIGSVEIVREALQFLGADRMKIYRMVQDMRERRLEIEGLRGSDADNKTLGVLYSELKEKVLA